MMTKILILPDNSPLSDYRWRVELWFGGEVDRMERTKGGYYEALQIGSEMLVAAAVDYNEVKEEIDEPA